MSEPLTAEDRLREAIAGERRDWHRVEVSSHDIEVVLATLDAARPSGEVDVERLTAAIQSDAVREFRFEDHTFPFSKAMAKIIAREYAALDGRREEG